MLSAELCGDDRGDCCCSRGEVSGDGFGDGVVEIRGSVIFSLGSSPGDVGDSSPRSGVGVGVGDGILRWAGGLLRDSKG